MPTVVYVVVADGPSECSVNAVGRECVNFCMNANEYECILFCMCFALNASHLECESEVNVDRFECSVYEV